MDIEVSFPGAKRVNARVGGFEVKTDQPRDLGGEASAIAPYDLFLASIATCAGVYVLGFCQARGLSTQGLTLIQRHEFDEVTHLVRAIRIEVKLPQGFPERYRAAVVRAAESCKVKKTIAAAPSFEVTLSDLPASTATGS